MHSLWSTLAAVDTPRAMDLIARVQDEFDQFIRSLPIDQMTLGRSSTPFDGLPKGISDWRLTDLTPALTGVPWLFWDLFEAAADKVFVQLALASVHLSLASILMDNLIDRQVRESKAAHLLYKSLYQQGEEILRENLPAAVDFWAFFHRLEAKHQRAWELEQMVQAHPKSFTKDPFESIGEGKSVPPLITVAAFLEVIELTELMPALRESITASVLASLAGDDTQDWAEDLAAQRWTYFLVRLSDEGDWPKNTWLDHEACQAIVDETWFDVQGWRETLAYLEKARAAVEEVPCLEWRRFLEKHQEMTENLGRAALARHLKNQLNTREHP